LLRNTLSHNLIKIERIEQHIKSQSRFQFVSNLNQNSESLTKMHLANKLDLLNINIERLETKPKKMKIHKG
jgi:hypothetical protein